MKLSDGEKLILMMLCELFEAQKVKSEIDPEFVKAAISGDHLWALRWEYSGIPFEREQTPPIVKDVVDILDMWSFIEHGFEKLTDAEKATLDQTVEHFGRNPKFAGFDGNNESEHMSVAYFLIDRLGRFQQFKGRDLNCHFPSLDAHHRMLQVFLPIRATLLMTPLSLNQLTQILQARAYPGV